MILQQSCFRPSRAGLFTLGQFLCMYRVAKPDERHRLIHKDPTMSQSQFILVSGPNTNVPLLERQLPSHIVLTDGQMMLLLKNKPPRILDTQEHGDEHSQMYADMFLYIPWSDENLFLGEARRSLAACQAMWEVWGEAAIDLKHQLREVVKSSWLS